MSLFWPDWIAKFPPFGSINLGWSPWPWNESLRSEPFVSPHRLASSVGHRTEKIPSLRNWVYFVWAVHLRKLRIFSLPRRWFNIDPIVHILTPTARSIVHPTKHRPTINQQNFNRIFRSLTILRIKRTAIVCAMNWIFRGGVYFKQEQLKVLEWNRMKSIHVIKKRIGRICKNCHWVRSVCARGTFVASVDYFIIFGGIFWQENSCFFNIRICRGRNNRLLKLTN